MGETESGRRTAGPGASIDPTCAGGSSVDREGDISYRVGSVEFAAGTAV
jgi:hypothetical protein